MIIWEKANCWLFLDSQHLGWGSTLLAGLLTTMFSANQRTGIPRGSFPSELKETKQSFRLDGKNCSGSLLRSWTTFVTALGPHMWPASFPLLPNTKPRHSTPCWDNAFLCGCCLCVHATVCMCMCMQRSGDVGDEDIVKGSCLARTFLSPEASSS